MIEISLRGQVAVVTGAAGIGRATALAPARADVATALADRNAAGLEETAAAIGGMGVARISEPGDVAAAILFLCVPQSRQITGQMIPTSAGAVV